MKVKINESYETPLSGEIKTHTVHVSPHVKNA